jgi:hypothetical protein
VHPADRAAATAPGGEAPGAPEHHARGIRTGQVSLQRKRTRWETITPLIGRDSSVHLDCRVLAGAGRLRAQPLLPDRHGSAPGGAIDPVLRYSHMANHRIAVMTNHLPGGKPESVRPHD